MDRTVDTAVAPAPAPDEESAFYWEGLRERRLLVQQCTHCHRRRFPAMPACPHCGTPGGEVVETEPQGTVYSWVVVHRAFDDAFAPDVPYVVAVVELAEGCRTVARVDAAGATMRGGLAVVGDFFDHDRADAGGSGSGGWTELRFRVAM